MSLMISGQANKEIAANLKIPLSTIQRRTRKLIENGTIVTRSEVNFEKMGVKSGSIFMMAI